MVGEAESTRQTTEKPREPECRQICSPRKKRKGRCSR